MSIAMMVNMHSTMEEICGVPVVPMMIAAQKAIANQGQCQEKREYISLSIDDWLAG
jgi:hypothetical protein